jgi:hypothetical protein
LDAVAVIDGVTVPVGVTAIGYHDKLYVLLPAEAPIIEMKYERLGPTQPGVLNNNCTDCCVVTPLAEAIGEDDTGQTRVPSAGPAT